MKRQRDHDALTAYLEGEFAKSARYDEATGRYVYSAGGLAFEAGGLLTWLRAVHYPDYVEGQAPSVRSKIKSGRPSNPMQGVRIDEDLVAVARGETIGLHPMSAALLAHWQRKGHSVVAAQVPVQLSANRMTKADVLTRDDKTGKLWCWEVKSGMPAALNEKQDRMRGLLGNVPCTKANQWHLQCEYTRLALVQKAGLPIAGARVIQVWEAARGGEIKVTEHRTPAWVKQLKLN
jgi:hypothetical protein